MKPNPVLKALGLTQDDRALLIHTDDIGMCHASLAAYMDLSRDGVISAGSTMVPCSWFPATATFCATHLDQVDMGVHITLNSEWSSGYRWAPVSTRDPASGLIDEEGYLPKTTQETQASATPEAVHEEIVAQVDRAVEVGIDVTHIDSHMGTVFYPGFIEGYIGVAIARGIPPFIVRKGAEELRARGLDSSVADELAGRVDTLEAQGLPMFDHVTSVPFTDPESHLDNTHQVLKGLPPGLTYLIIHPAKDTPELRAILPEGWQARVADYEVFMRPELRSYFEKLGIRLIGWHELRALMRSQT